MAIDLQLANKVAGFLNSALAHDSNAVTKLMMHRVECGKAMATHPTIQVKAFPGEPYMVGILGLLNGMVGSYDDGPKKGHGALVADLHDGKITGFRVLPNEE